MANLVFIIFTYEEIFWWLLTLICVCHGSENSNRTFTTQFTTKAGITSYKAEYTLYFNTDTTVLLNCSCHNESNSQWLGQKRHRTEVKDNPLIPYSQGLKLNPILKNSNVDVIGGYDDGQCTLEIRHFSVNDAGVYICHTLLTGEVRTHIYYLIAKNLSSLKISYNYTESFIQLGCKPSVFPQNYTCFRWEHMSHFNEHIRYLNGTEDGQLTVKRTLGRNDRYQDNGIYICRCSIGISKENGSINQDNRTNIVLEDEPAFMSDNQKVYYHDYGRHGKERKITVAIYSNPGPTNATIHRRVEMDHFLKAISNQTIRAFYLQHNSNVSMLTMQLVFRLKIETAEDFDDYIITVCNNYGCNKFSIGVWSANSSSYRQRLEWLSLLLLILICLVIGIAVNKKNRRITNNSINEIEYDRRNEDTDDAIQGNAVDNRLYQSAEDLNSQVENGAMSIEMADVSHPTFCDNSNQCLNPLFSINYLAPAVQGTIMNNANSRNVGLKTGKASLNYSEIVFGPPLSSGTSVIHGIEDRTIYSDINLSLSAVLPESSSGSDTNDESACEDEIQEMDVDREGI